MAPPTRDLGTIDFADVIASQWVDVNEFVPDLQWPLSVQMYARMRHDPKLTAILKAYSLPIRRATWAVDPAGCRDEVVQTVADDLGLPVLGQDRGPGPARRRGVSWSEHLRLALLSLTYGHMCVDEETEALTQRGWVNGDDLREGDELLTLNPETGLSEWHPCIAVHRYPGQHLVRRLDGRSHSSVTTLDHNWIVRKNSYGRAPSDRQRRVRADKSPELVFTTTAKLNANDEIIQAAPCVTLPEEAKYADAFVELVGWVLAEGSYYPGGKYFAVWQSERVNPRHVASIRGVMQRLYGPPVRSMRRGTAPHTAPMYVETFRDDKDVICWRMNRAASDPLVEVFADPKKKVVRPEFIASLTAAQLHLFIQAAMDGDGHTTASARRTFGQKEPARLDGIAMACALLGVPTTTYQVAEEHWELSLRTRVHTRPIANARRADNNRSVDVVETYEGTVWCPSVPPNRTWLARRRGTVYFTGNCFERRYEIRNGQARLVNLGERMPWTIGEIDLNPDGTIKQVKQEYGVAKAMPANRLVWYAHEREGATWTGRSLLRPAYGPWLLKHELWRVNGTGIRRFAMGVPNVEAPAGATPAQVQEAQRLASSMRVGDTAGVGLPSGFKLNITGMTGSAPDAMEMIRYLDQQMSTFALAGFLDLGQTETGSRALGESFVDLFMLSLQAVADGLADVATSGQPGMTGAVTDLVDMNWGEDEPAPRIVCTDVGKRHDLAADALTGLITAGAITADPDLEAWLRQSYRMPPRAQEDAASGRSYEYDLDFGILTINERRAQIGLPPVADGDKIAEPSNLRVAPPAPASAPAAPASGGGAGAAPTSAAARPRSPRRRRTPRDVRAAGDEDAGHRQLTTIEAASGFDPNEIQAANQTALDDLIEAWAAIQTATLAALIAQVSAAVAAGETATLAALEVDTAPAAAVLAPALIAMAGAGAGQVVAEAAAQGVKLTKPDLDEDALTTLADTIAALMGSATADAAGREALRVWTPGASGDDVAALVQTHMESLTDAWPREQLGGALWAAQAHGRWAAIDSAPDAKWIASEVLDRNTCEPCREIDGHEFESKAAAGAAYGSGGYIECLGRERCRGVLLAIWEEGQ